MSLLAGESLLAEESEGKVTEEGTGCGTDNDVAEEVHAEDDAAGGNREADEGKFDRVFRVENHERGEYREGCDGVARWEAEAIGREEFGPAVGFEVAGAAAGKAFCPEEERDANTGGEERTGNCEVAFRSTEEQNDDGECVPEPAITATGGADHPHADPLGGAPLLDTVHDAVVAGFDEVADERKHTHWADSVTRTLKSSAPPRTVRPENI